MSFELRLQALEAVVAKMTNDQAHLSSVKAIVSKTPHLYNISAVLKQYDRKLKALTHSLSVNKSLVKYLNVSFPKTQQKTEAQISTVVKRRNRWVSSIESKIPVLETSYKDLQNSDEKTNETIKDEVKSDINGTVLSMLKQGTEKSSACANQIKNCSKRIKAKSDKVTELSTQVQVKMRAFIKENFNRLTSIEPPEMYNPTTYEGIESMADLLAQRARPNVLDKISLVKEEFNLKFNDLVVFCNTEVLTFRSELQVQKEKNLPALKNSTKPDVMLNSSLEVIRSTIKHVNYFVNPGLTSITDISSVYTDNHDITLHKDVALTTREQLTAFEKKLQESNALIDELLGKANGFVKSCKNKKLPAKLKNVEKEVVNFRSNSKETLVKAKTKVDAFLAKIPENHADC